MITKEKKSKIGKKSRAAGKRFELSVRKELESRGWIVCKWTNTVIFDNNGNGKLEPAKSKYNPFLKRIISEGAGWPDYIGIRRNKKFFNFFDVIGIESKMNIKTGLDYEERKKAVFYLNHKIFNNLYIAYKEKNGRKTIIKYINIIKKYPKLI